VPIYDGFSSRNAKLRVAVALPKMIVSQDARNRTVSKGAWAAVKTPLHNLVTSTSSPITELADRSAFRFENQAW